MKISLAWLCDHLDYASFAVRLTPAQIVAKLRVSTAEIDKVIELNIAIDKMFLGRVTTHDDRGITVVVPELKKTCTLPVRTLSAYTDAWYLVWHEQAQTRWVTLGDCGCTAKEGLMPAIIANEAEAKSGNWRSTIPATDTLIEIESKAITNRPDLWCHRGFAREVAALLGVGLVGDERLYANYPVRHYEKQSPASAALHVSLEDAHGCKRYAAALFDNVTARPSSLLHAFKLARVDQRPIDALVDATNYVMMDIAQPLHVFDQALLGGNELVIRRAHADEHLTLLGGSQLTLTTNDLVIATNTKAVALAGIKGGEDTGASAATKTIVVEAATFDATTIRLMAKRHKLRTDASARFEKSLDPNSNTLGILRFATVFNQMTQQQLSIEGALISVGKLEPERVITVSHDYLIKRLGVALTTERVARVLTGFGFGVSINGHEQYEVSVPSFRAGKDIQAQEDILEEVARAIGYETIPLSLPAKERVLTSLPQTLRLQAIKSHAAYALGMHEAATYPLLDDAWIAKIGYKPEDYVELANPVAENARILVPSLIPNLLRAAEQNCTRASTLRFFECGRTWRLIAKTSPSERQSFACLMVSKQPGSFYQGKADLQSLFHSLGIAPTWQRVQRQAAVWWHEEQTAELLLGEKTLGYAGSLQSKLLSLGEWKYGFWAELDLEQLLAVPGAAKVYAPLSRYQSVTLDVSVFIPKRVTVEELGNVIKKQDSRIESVELIDFYEKAEWRDVRSVTLRYTVVDHEKTMQKAEIDQIMGAVAAAMMALDGQVR
jgi:phenylalanyl-tRNA synthetase beta chain